VAGRHTIMQWMPVVVVAREQPWQFTALYTVLLLAGGQHPAWVEMNVVQSVELEALAAMAKSQAAEARKRRILRILAVLL
jgi:predicted GTPase